jgi:hypothetical protein
MRFRDGHPAQHVAQCGPNQTCRHPDEYLTKSEPYAGNFPKFQLDLFLRILILDARAIVRFVRMPVQIPEDENTEYSSIRSSLLTVVCERIHSIPSLIQFIRPVLRYIALGREDSIENADSGR